VRFEYKGGYILTVIREPGDPAPFNPIEARGESTLLHHIKKKLNAAGFDLIKKRAWKDGHLLDERQQYLRTRNHKSPGPHVFLINPVWAIKGLDEEWRQDGMCTLEIYFNIFGVRTDEEDRKLFAELISGVQARS